MRRSHRPGGSSRLDAACRRVLCRAVLAAALLVWRLEARPPSGQSPDPAVVARGRQVFEQFKCVLCHSLEGKGGKLAVPLDDVGLRRNAAGLRKVLENPQAEFPASKVKMPVFTFTEAEREALVAYLLTLRRKP